MTKKQLQKIVQKLTDASFKEGRILESQVIKSIKVLKSLSQPQAITAMGAYLNAVKRVERKYTMIVETSIPLSSATIQKMKKIVEKKNTITKVIVNINPEILGGFKLKIGDEVYDETILEKINQVKEVIRGRSSSTN